MERNLPPNKRVMGDSADLTCNRGANKHCINASERINLTVRVITIRFRLPTSIHPSSSGGSSSSRSSIDAPAFDTLLGEIVLVIESNSSSSVSK